MHTGSRADQAVSTVIIVQLGAVKQLTRPLTEDYMYMNPRLGLGSALCGTKSTHNRKSSVSVCFLGGHCKLRRTSMVLFNFHRGCGLAAPCFAYIYIFSFRCW